MMGWMGSRCRLLVACVWEWNQPLLHCVALPIPFDPWNAGNARTPIPFFLEGCCMYLECTNKSTHVFHPSPFVLVHGPSSRVPLPNRWSTLRDPISDTVVWEIFWWCGSPPLVFLSSHRSTDRLEIRNRIRGTDRPRQIERKGFGCHDVGRFRRIETCADEDENGCTSVSSSPGSSNDGDRDRRYFRIRRWRGRASTPHAFPAVRSIPGPVLAKVSSPAWQIA